MISGFNHITIATDLIQSEDANNIYSAIIDDDISSKLVAFSKNEKPIYCVFDNTSDVSSIRHLTVVLNKLFVDIGEVHAFTYSGIIPLGNDFVTVFIAIFTAPEILTTVTITTPI